MADSSFPYPDAVTLDGTEHVLIGQSGNYRRVLLSTLIAMTLTKLTFPTADPHVVGSLWSNSGVVTVSAG